MEPMEKTSPPERRWIASRFRASPLWLWIALCTALAIANGGLLLRISTLETALIETHELLRQAMSVSPGDLLQALTGRDVQGERLEIAHGRDGRRTVLLVFSPVCAASEAMWSRWRRMVGHLDAHRFRPVAVDVTSTTSEKFIETHGLRGYEVIAAPDPGAVKSHRLSITPQVILVDSRGVVEMVWTGANLDARALQDQAARLALPPSLMASPR
jgi:hypothetical protein